MGFYRKKPVIIEAIQWKGYNPHQVLYFMDIEHLDRQGDKLLIPTLEGVMEASLNDWIIKGVKGEVYPCKPDIFEATYENASIKDL